jgi:hypothetical protein
VWVWPLLIVIGLGLFGSIAFRLVRGGGPASEAARRILDDRFTRGEIDKHDCRPVAQLAHVIRALGLRRDCPTRADDALSPGHLQAPPFDLVQRLTVGRRADAPARISQ